MKGVAYYESERNNSGPYNYIWIVKIQRLHDHLKKLHDLIF